MNYNKFLQAKIERSAPTGFDVPLADLAQDCQNSELTPIASLEAVDIKHRILNIGTYNIEVSSCGICASNVEIEIFGKHCLGFGSPSLRAGDIEKTLAVVYECPVCFQRQWSHSTVTGGYYMYLRHRHHRNSHFDMME